MSDVGVIVLAAGASTRMGRPKQLLEFEGQTLLRRSATAAVGSGGSPVVVVLGSRADELAVQLIGLPVQTTVNHQWESGIGSSIRCGVRTALKQKTVSSVLIMLADQPLVTAAMLQRLIETFAASGKSACVSAYGGSVGPPVVVGPQLLPDLLAIPDDSGAKYIWTSRRQAVATINLPEAAIDVDVPEDYRRLQTARPG